MNTDAVVFILLGQSNAVGHKLPMDEQDKILIPLKNVFGLSRDKNQSYDTQELSWEGYVSGGMNLGETQDHTYSVANCLATQWQAAIDAGRSLPDLYIVHVAIGGQGVTQNYMWYPDREPKLVPGILHTVDISLHSLTKHILSLLPDSFRKRGLSVRYMLHWRGGEEDITVKEDPLRQQLLSIYRRIFAEYNAAVKQDIPITVHQVDFKERCMDLDSSGEFLKSMYVIAETFKLLAKDPGISLFDVRECPFYDPSSREHGIYMEDVVHYTSQVNSWVASEILKGCLESLDPFCDIPA